MDEENINEEVKVNKITSKNIIFMLVWILFFIYVIYQVYILLMYTLGKKERNGLWLYNFSNNLIATFIKKDDSKIEDYNLTFACIGDIYFTDSRLKSIKDVNGYDFTYGIDKVCDKLKDYDIVVASLNTPIINSNLGYSKGKIYGAPQKITEMIKLLNISAVATATSHAFDKGKKGISQTIETLENEQINQVGISSNNVRRNPIILNKNNISIGFLSYTTESNVAISKDNKYTVNVFNEDDLTIDINYLKSQNVDFIVSYINVPSENSTIVSYEQKLITEKLFSSGVDVVLGSGNSIVQEDIKEEIEEGKYIYGIYSLGDFYGNFESEDNLVNVIANIEFKKSIIKDRDGNIENIEKYMIVNEPIKIWNSINSSNLSTMYLLEEEIEKYKSGESEITLKDYNSIKKIQEKLVNLFN